MEEGGYSEDHQNDTFSMSCNRYVIRSSYITFCNWSVIPPSQSPLKRAPPPDYPSNLKWKEIITIDLLFFFFFKSLEKYKKITNYFSTFLFLLLLLAGWACPPSSSNKKIKRHFPFDLFFFFLLEDFPKGKKSKKTVRQTPSPPAKICRIPYTNLSNTPHHIFLCVFWHLFLFLCILKVRIATGKIAIFSLKSCG